ncbi:malate synthase G, partial [Acinetobacter baumannii]
LEGASHKDSTGYAIVNGQLAVTVGGKTVGLKNPAQLVGYQGDAAAPSSVLLVNNGMHVDIQINRNTNIGKTDAAGVADVVL